MKLLISTKVLCHFHPKLPLKLDCDSSPYGVAAVLSHVFSEGLERPIAYASRTLSPAENKLLAARQGSTRHHIRRSTIYSVSLRKSFQLGHRSQTSTCNLRRKGCDSPAVAATRLERWALLLSTFGYDISYRITARITF